METVSLSYDELAERMRINPHSARNLVRRKRWKRTVGNDGKARVSVPREALVAPSTSPSAPPLEAPSPAAESGVTIARLEVQIDGLKALVEAERRRADAAEADRDRWHASANRPFWRRFALSH
jgi:hypothetical protein